MGALILAGTGAAIATTGSLITGALTNADSVVNRAVEATRGAVSTVMNSGAATARGGNGYVPTVDEIARWERKMNRSSSLRGGIQVRPRVQCFPYTRSAPHIATPFAEMAGDTLNIGELGGIVWAVKANVEGGYSQAGSWNRNTGNVKLYSGLARQPTTPECWFLKDGVNSEDMYQSFGVGVNDRTPQYLEDNPSAWRAAIQDAFNRTFGQPHYQNSWAMVDNVRVSFMDCLRRGLLQQVCAIMGGNGYAVSYLTGTFMTARYRRMYTSGWNGRSMIRPNSLVIKPVGRVVRRSSGHNFTEVF